MFIAERLLAMLAPYECLQCGKEGDVVCAWCMNEHILALPSRCYSCKAVTLDFAVCKVCKRKSALKHVWVATEYSGLAKEVVQNYKFRSARGAGKVMARSMSYTLPYLSRDTVVVPVPSATVRNRQRGFDHTLLLAKNIGAKSGLLVSAVVGRLGQSRQVGATRDKRRSQLRDSFIVNKHYMIKGKDVLLIDDIVTTGGTLESVARALKNAGARTVSAVTFAQKL